MVALKRTKVYIQRRADREKLISKVMPSVWGMESRPKSEQYINRAHYNHYDEILHNKHLIDSEHVDLRKLEDVSHLVRVLRDNKDFSIAEIEKAIQGQSFSWLADSEDATLKQVLELAVRLWLFVRPVLDDKQKTLATAMREGLERGGLLKATVVTQSDPRYLKPDFSAKSLMEIGGITLVWTSYLDEHLTFAEKKHLRIFRHASALYHYQKSDESTLYPDHFLEQTANTIQLLWPSGHVSGRRRLKTCKREGVDLEAQMAEIDMLDLAAYPDWRHRLSAVQKALDDARPTTLAQWWFDRRDKPQWATFWVAVVVFILTVVFGIISSVTGIIQVA